MTKKYDPETEFISNGYRAIMEQDPDGEYIHIDDYNRTQKALNVCYQWFVDNDESDMLDIIDGITERP